MNKALLAAILLGTTLLSANAMGDEKEPDAHPPVRPAWSSPIAGPGDYLGISPYIDWKTIETENFRITFPKEMAPTAQKIARFYEEAHRLMSPLLRWTPHYRTQVLLIDNTDLANGLTSALLRFGMLLMITPPDNWFSTAYYDDWLRLLVIHEYTHFLNLDTTVDAWEVLRYVFGDSLLPNSTWPTWMLEGLAVYMETRFTQSGRGRSPYYEMILRSAVQDGVLDSSKYITLDKVNGPNPWPPGGETAYLFGYQLMNQVAKENGDVLGEMSYRSGSRFPYFINGNLENITGKDWYKFWDDFVAQTRERMDAQLKKIRSQPLSPIEPLTEGFNTILGSAVSPDGKWIAYTLSSPDERMGLYLKDLKSGETRRIEDKADGATLAFTPDSKHLLFSKIARRDKYNLWSDLAILDVEPNSVHWLSDSLRARDPSVSRDGKWVTFTLTDDATTGVAVAPLEADGDSLKLGAVRKLHWPAKYARAATPVFSPDGSAVVFSLHVNGQASEEIMAVPTTGSGAPIAIVSDGRMNRFPAFNQSGKLHFLSDLTGVDNVYSVDWNGANSKPTLVTNVTTGLAFPTFGGDTLYANVYTYQGWNLARVGTSAVRLPAPQAREKLSVEPPVSSARATDADALAKAAQARETTADFPVKDYSVWPSILPRQWAPLLLVDSNTTSIGGQFLGFDATDVHRYIATATYETATKKADYGVAYSNRQLGPVITLSSSLSTDSELFYGGTLNQYTRTQDFAISLSYPFQWTYSSLTPILMFKTEREWLYGPGLNPKDNDIIYRYPYIPEVSGLLVYNDAEGSGLGISNEKGRTTLLGTRAYLDNSHTIWKEYFQDIEYFKLPAHTALVPSVKGMVTSSLNTPSESPKVVTRGNRLRLIDPLVDDPFETIAIRGYPGTKFVTQAVGVASLDYRYPLWHIFRGWGTNPLFLENLYGFVFAETGWFPNKDPGRALLPSAGTGLRTSVDLLNYVPLVLSLEYHKGFIEEAGGDDEVFFQLSLGSFGI